LAIVPIILADYPAIKIIVLSSDPAPALIEEALRLGVSGYVFRENVFDEVVRAIEATMAGNLYLCPAATTGLMRNRGPKGEGTPVAAPRLSEREKQLFALCGRRDAQQGNWRSA